VLYKVEKESTGVNVELVVLKRTWVKVEVALQKSLDLKIINEIYSTTNKAV
jgi:hypothetical protein